MKSDDFKDFTLNKENNAFVLPQPYKIIQGGQLFMDDTLEVP